MERSRQARSDPPMTLARIHDARGRQELRRLLAALVASGKNWHASTRGSAHAARVASSCASTPSNAARCVRRPRRRAAAAPIPRQRRGTSATPARTASAVVYIAPCDRPQGRARPRRRAIRGTQALGPVAGASRRLVTTAPTSSGGNARRWKPTTVEAQKGKTLRLLLDTYVDWLKAKGKQRSPTTPRTSCASTCSSAGPRCAPNRAQVTRDELANVVNVDATGKERTAGKIRTFIARPTRRADGGQERQSAGFVQGLRHPVHPARDIDYKVPGSRPRAHLAPRELGRLLVLLRRTSRSRRSSAHPHRPRGSAQQQLWRTRSSDVDCDEHTGKLAQWDPRATAASRVGMKCHSRATRRKVRRWCDGEAQRHAAAVHDRWSRPDP